MENRVYYGQYSLMHWIELILKKNIVLPEYQRLFVWNEEKVKGLIQTFKNKQYVPSVTIGSYKNNKDITQNLILDGQQRLTSILLAYLNLYPDKEKFRSTLATQRDENDNDEFEEEADKLQYKVLQWRFNLLIDNSTSKKQILAKSETKHYKSLDLNISDDFLRNHFLAFSYIVPDEADSQIQQKFYSTVFRNINILGQTLIPQESRRSLYFLDDEKKAFFEPDFIKEQLINYKGEENPIDLVRYLAFLSQYAVHNDAHDIASGYGYLYRREKYYEDYIYAVVDEEKFEKSYMFKSFDDIFKHSNFETRYKHLNTFINTEIFKKEFTSIIDLDIYLFGAIYWIVFEDKKIDDTKIGQLNNELNNKINEIKNPSDETDNETKRASYLHTKSPAALKYLRHRIQMSIDIYSNYTKEENVNG